MCDQDGNTWYCEWQVDPQTRIVTPKQEDLEFLCSVVSNPDIPKVYHNARFDIRMLQSLGVEQKGWFDDTLIAARVCYTVEQAYGLKYLAKKYANIGTDDEKQMDDAIKICRRRAQAANRQYIKYNPECSEDELPYCLGEDAGGDAWILRNMLHPSDPAYWYCEQYCRRDCERTAVLLMLYKSIMAREGECRITYMREMELWHTVWGMEDRGIAVSFEEIDKEIKVSKRLTAEALEMMKAHLKDDLGWTEEQVEGTPKERYRELAKIGRKPEVGFNPASPPQIVKIMYDGYGFDVDPQYGRSSKLLALTPHISHPFVRNLILYRMHYQRTNTFLGVYRDLSTPDTIIPGGKALHPGFDQVGTATGRFSCRDPNMQQVSTIASSKIHAFQAVTVRSVFGPRKGYRMYTVDYSQQEVRIFADLSRSPFLLGVMERGEDIYEATSNRIWGGRNNPHALNMAAISLELFEEWPVEGAYYDKVVQTWQHLGWKRGDSLRRGAKQRQLELANQWLSEFNYDIVAAERTLGKKKTRSRAKTSFLAKIYGGGAEKMAGYMGGTVEETRTWLNQFDQAMPDIKIFMQTMIRMARSQGYVVNPYGRKLRAESGFEYRSVNHLIQSTGADMIKSSMVMIDEFFQREDVRGHLLLTIHDELVYEIPRRFDAPWIHEEIKRILEDVPIDITAAIPYGPKITVKMLAEFKKVEKQWDVAEAIEV